MITLHYDVIQGTDEWFAKRCGLLTASEMRLIITPQKLEYAKNEKEKQHLYDLLSQRITGHNERSFQTFDMMRGKEEERLAKDVYEKNYAPVVELGFITNERWGFTLGYSPDGLVGENGIIEIKSRAAKYQLETILSDEVPQEFMLQIQTGLLVSARDWCDFISYSGGMPMFTKRVEADYVMQGKIVEAATIFHHKMDRLLGEYQSMLIPGEHRLVPTERTIFDEEISV